MYKDCNKMHGQQNIKFCVLPLLYMTEDLAAFILEGENINEPPPKKMKFSPLLMYIVRSTKFGRNVLFRYMKHAGRRSLYTASSKNALNSECCNSGRHAMRSVWYSKPNRKLIHCVVTTEQ